MNVSDAILGRKSVRQFLPTPVDGELIRRVLAKASQAPSSGNLQPWHVHIVANSALEKLKAKVAVRLVEAPNGEDEEYLTYPPSLKSPYRERRFANGEDLYRSINIPREDKPARLKQMAKNFRFFGAPMAFFLSVDRCMGNAQWADLGMFMQSVMLLLHEEDIATCAQRCWARYHKTIGAHIGIPAEHALFCGMAIGYEDTSAPINHWRSSRAPIDEFVTFVDA